MQWKLEPPVLAAGAVGGFIAGALFGSLMPADEMMPMVAGLYGLDGVVEGWLIHLAHSVVFGLLFAAIVTMVPASPVTSSLMGVTVIGAAYGIVLWVIGASFVMPIWIGAVTDMSPSVPDFSWMSFVGHLVYGVTLAGILSALGTGQVVRQVVR